MRGASRRAIAEPGPLPRLCATASGAKDRLRFTAPNAQVRPTFPPDNGQPIRGTTDPRWVLAVRAAESLEGNTLDPGTRDRLVRLGKTMGLTAFDGNLIIAIVQDQARRGYAPAYCPTAGEPQLRMVPPPYLRSWRHRSLRRVSLVFFVLIAFETTVLLWYF